jgi:RimJ/RimL family protein N-acetyltransferase
MKLEGTRVLLRPLAEQDMDLILRWRADPVVLDEMFSERPPTREEHLAWFAKLQQENRRHEFMIILRDSGQAVGTIGLSNIDRECGVAEYGIFIGESEWRGHGLSREASELILGYAFDSLALEAVICRLFADNAPARTLYRRIGFVEDPALAEVCRKNDKLRPVMTMRITRDRWKSA